MNASTRFVIDKHGFAEYIFPKSIDYAERCFLTNEASWPTAEQLGLDGSQYDAVKLALSNKLALIQGYIIFFKF
jgi:hypothetical protein